MTKDNIFPFTLISFQHGRCGHQEDDWQRITHINNKEELLQELKEGYLADSRNRNNFPIISTPIKRIYLKNTNISDSYGTDQLGGYELNGEYIPGPKDYRYEINEFDSDDMAQFTDVFLKFKEWKLRIYTLIPKIRKISKDQEKQNYELKELKRLAKKYDYKLIKDRKWHF